MSDTQPGQDPAYQDALIAYLMGGGDPNMPYMNPAQVSGIYGAVPPNLNPGQQGNYLQDYLSIMLDPAVAALFGSGAYGADAFAPTTTYEPVATPGRDQLMRYMQRPGTIEAFIAEQILSGGSSSSAIAELRQAYEANPEDPEVADLVSQLPLHEDDAGGWETDWDAAGQRFTAMEETFMSDPTAGSIGAIIDPQSGEVISPAEEIVQMVDEMGNPTLVRVQQEEAPMAEWFRDRGLSLPTDVYTPEDLLGQEWAMGQGRVQEARSAFEEAQQRFLEADRAAVPTNEAENFAMNTFGASAGQQAVERTGFGAQPNYDLSTGTSPTGAIQEAANYSLPSITGQPTVEQIYQNAEMGPAPTELTMPQTAEEFAAYTEGTWSRLSPEQRNAMIEFAVGQAFNEQVENGPWQQVVDDMTGESAVNPVQRSLNEPTSRAEVRRGYVSFPHANEEPEPSPLPMSEQAPWGSSSPTSAPMSEGAPWSSPLPTPTSAPASERALTTQTSPGSAQLRFLLDRAGAAGRRADQKRTETRYRERDRQRAGSMRAFQQLTEETGRTYGADYGRAAAQAWLMQQQGITPLQQQMAARRQVPIGMGLVGSGYLPGM